MRAFQNGVWIRNCGKNLPFNEMSECFPFLKESWLWNCLLFGSDSFNQSLLLFFFKFPVVKLQKEDIKKKIGEGTD